MKKFLIVLLVLALVLALAVAGWAGFIWYRENHIFVDGEAYPIAARSLDLREKDITREHYDQVHGQLPNCEILWNVPFQGGRVSSDSTQLQIKSISMDDMAMLRYFPNLKKIDASACEDYAMLFVLQERLPGCEIVYQINLGGSYVDRNSTALELDKGDYTPDLLIENLRYLPGLTELKLRMPEMTPEQMEKLQSTYEELTIHCTVELRGQEYDTDTTELDLRGLKPEEAAEVAGKLAMLPNLETVELMDGENCELSKEDVKTLQQAAPGAVFHYVFDFYGDVISTADEEVYISRKKIGDEGIDEVRLALDIMGKNCKRFVLEDCGISYELLAQVREEYREKTNLVWRIYFGKMNNGAQGSCLTDREVIKAVYGLYDSNSKDLIYCEGARFIDFGHNEYLNDCGFVAGMPNLEAIILSGSPIKDLTPFQNCKKLKFLEIAFCGYIEDLSPLAGCESLEMLNISYTKASDLSPLNELPMTLLCAKNAKVSPEEEARFRELQPDCWSQFQKGPAENIQPYGAGWRYTEDGKAELPYYAMLAEVFEYKKGVEAGINYTHW